MRNFDYAKYASKLESMDGDDLVELEYYLVADMEEGDVVHLTNLVSLIQDEYMKRGY
jgi:hypothetical protein